MNALTSSLTFQRDEAERSIDSLLRIGVADDMISVIIGESTRDILFGTHTHGAKTPHGAGAHYERKGAELLINLVAAASPVSRSLFCPAVCLMGSGPLVSRLALLGSGGGNKSIHEAFYDLGISVSMARRYVSGLRSRGIIICADVSDLCATEIQRMVNFHSEFDCQASFGRV